MAHAVIWHYTDSEGEVKVLMGHPGAFPLTEEEAKEEGRRIIQGLESYNLKPLCIAETDEDIHEDILECEEIYLGPEDDDEIFYDISNLGRWACRDWWPL